MQNYVVGDFGKVHMTNGEAHNIVGMRDVHIILPNKNI